MATSTYTLSSSEMGSSIPANLPHAISVSLPKWQDNVDYEEGRPRVMDAMQTGYPRFFVHRTIQKAGLTQRQLATMCEQRFGRADERAMLFPSGKIASECARFMISQSREPGPLPVRTTHFVLHPSEQDGPAEPTELHIVLFPSAAWPLAKQFWQHTGLGVSSRMAERCVQLWSEGANGTPAEERGHDTAANGGLLGKHRSARSRYGRKPSIGAPLSPTETSVDPPRAPAFPPPAQAEDMSTDHAAYIEERYGRNLPLSKASLAKQALRRRIAGTLAHESEEMEVHGRGVEGVTEDDVFLMSTGMTAIWYAHQLALVTREPAKSICFGFPYTDTLKILEKWGPGCYFYGHGLDSSIDELEERLQTGEKILALFCEFPSNPLLRSPNLPRLRKLADQYDFLIVVDETIGNFVNVEVLPYADVLASSLTKVFSGETNVMGGSLVLNPKGRHYAALKTAMGTLYEDTYWPEDAIFMERNSRTFIPRVYTINENAEAVCEMLHARIGSSTVKEVCYPKYSSRENYEACRIPARDDRPAGGFGGLFSVVFTSVTASKAFFDALPCEKGPSLGTSFTLACPYTVIAHYLELDWAAGWGVETSLVRVSVGMEDKGSLLRGFSEAMEAADKAVANESS
ncbi:PLP-dependent transferase [Calocera viscosa TUFC12733]|uniref:cystathionine gamma-synthase n=1 Tax=Calocera viscosa (strain TUFC12733) TaxID=1330018 RepID=A0A167K104_CALVF|nr:PLP-dependent transferase [Calocera viscosa TUFC12733]